MTPARWILLAAAALVLTIVVAGGSWRGDDPGKKSAPSASAKSSRGTSAPTHGRELALRQPVDPSDGVTLQDLPAHLRKFVLDLERRAEQLGDDYTYATLLRARESLPPLLDQLTAEDVRDLILFYRHARVDWHVLGETLLLNDLYERWGRLDPPAATAFIEQRLKESLAALKRPEEKVAFNDPFGEGPDLSEFGSIFEGWAFVDPRAGIRAWDELRERIVRDPRIDRFEYVRDSIYGALLRGWARQDPRRAWQHIFHELEQPKDTLVASVIAGLGPDAPWEPFIDDLWHRAPDIASASGPGFIGRWASHDPDAALAWIERHSREEETLNASMFNFWFTMDTSGRSVEWLRDSAVSLPPPLRFVALRHALALQRDHLDDLLPLVTTLERDDSTWLLLRALGNANDPNPFGAVIMDHIGLQIPELEPGPLRDLMNQLSAPDELRADIEAAIAESAERPAP